MNAKNLEACRFALGYVVAWRGLVLIAGSKNGIRRLMRKHARAEAQA